MPPPSNALTPIEFEIPVLSSIQAGARRFLEGPYNQSTSHNLHTYGPEPLRCRPSEKSSRQARIVSRFADPERVAYIVEIGGIETGQLGVEEILNYVSPFELEKFENERFVEEREVLETYEIERKLEEKAGHERDRANIHPMRSVQSSEDTAREETEETNPVPTGRHGRARPTYKHMFPQFKERRRRKRDAKTGELMPLSDEEDLPPPRKVAPQLSWHDEAASRLVSLEPPKRRRRKRDKVTGELLPLSPRLEGEESEQNPSSSDVMIAQRTSSHMHAEPPQMLGAPREKRRRRRRHPITNELMPIGWRYQPGTELKESDNEAKNPAREMVPAIKRLSIAREPEPKRARIRSGSSDSDQSSSDHLAQWQSSMSVRNTGGPRSELPPNASRADESTLFAPAREPKDPRQRPIDRDFKHTSSPRVISLPFFNITRPAAFPTEFSRDGLLRENMLASFPKTASQNSQQGKTNDSNSKAGTMDLTADDVSEQEPSEDEFFIEDILDHRLSDPRTHRDEFGKDPVMLYQVKWEGYNETTWEPIESFHDRSAVEDYRRRVGLGINGKPAKASGVGGVKDASSLRGVQDDKAHNGDEVEDILGHRMTEIRAGRSPQVIYLIKWVGKAQPTWESIDGFHDTGNLERYKERVAIKASLQEQDHVDEGYDDDDDDDNDDDGAISI